jgi:hypothetical protein
MVTNILHNAENSRVATVWSKLHGCDVHVRLVDETVIEKHGVTRWSLIYSTMPRRRGLLRRKSFRGGQLLLAGDKLPLQLLGPAIPAMGSANSWIDTHART